MAVAGGHLASTVFCGTISCFKFELSHFPQEHKESVVLIQQQRPQMNVFSNCMQIQTMVHPTHNTCGTT